MTSMNAAADYSEAHSEAAKVTTAADTTPSRDAYRTAQAARVRAALAATMAGLPHATQLAHSEEANRLGALADKLAFPAKRATRRAS